MATSQRPILITGATGQVGGALARLMPHALTPSRAQLDLTNPDSIRLAIRTLRPAWILNPAAYTAVDRAETDVDCAYAVNSEAVAILGEEGRRIGAAVVHFSTDYVFPGTGSTPYKESDPIGPLGVYGASKLAGEQALAASGAAHLILRTSWVYAPTGKNFLLTVLRVARERSEMRIVDDQHGAPTTAATLARVTAQILEHCTHNPDALAAVGGTYHAAAGGETTWFGFAQEALRLQELAEPHTRFAALVPIPSCDYPTPARRPANSRLDCGKLTSTFGLTLEPWQQALADTSAQLQPA